MESRLFNSIWRRSGMFQSKTYLYLLLLTVSIAFSVHAQTGFFDMDILDVEAKLSVDKAHPGKIMKIAVIADIDPEFHINAHKPSEEYLIPTILKFDPVDKISFGKIEYPEEEMVKFPFADEPIAVYEGQTVIRSEIILAGDIEPGTIQISGTLSYQACNDENCFAPAEEKFSIPVEVVDEDESVLQINQDLFAAAEEIVVEEDEPAEQAAVSFTTDELRAKEIIEKGLPYALVAFFIFGLALNLTPCVYPVIPLTVGYFGGQSRQQKGSTFLISVTYVIGIALIFALLGLVSGLAGKQWGFLFQNPWFVVIIATIILSMAASMFGAFEIAVPEWMTAKLGKSREGVAGALIMGLTVGVVIAPCAAGIIIGLVGLVAKLGIVAKGTLLFFIMGLGLGLPYLILANFSSLMNKLPQSGMWMVWIRKLFGVLLIGVALYFLLPQVKHIYDKQSFFFGVLAIFGGLLLGFLDHEPGYTKCFKIGRAIFGILVIILGISLTNNAIQSEPPSIGWIEYEDEQIEDFMQEGKPVFIDFYADWCAPCKQMDRETFEHPAITGKAKEFTMLKVDCTAPDDDIRNFMNNFEVTGMPTYIFLTDDGTELKELREVGYVEWDVFLEKMEKTIAASENGN
ncbi:thioredoxin fold domain-containing protein, partial [candidate division KSB1 bacterium]|nr:thioredoxin fold domain-containing protein [candidate division KSB1 bacterium]